MSWSVLFGGHCGGHTWTAAPQCLAMTQSESVTTVHPRSPLQDYESIVKLVETLEKLPTFDPVAHPHVKFHYAFALNR